MSKQYMKKEQSRTNKDILVKKQVCSIFLACVAHLVGALPFIMKGLEFNSWMGHMLRLLVHSSLGVYQRQPINVSLLLLLLLCPSL